MSADLRCLSLSFCSLSDCYDACHNLEINVVYRQRLLMVSNFRAVRDSVFLERAMRLRRFQIVCNVKLLGGLTGRGLVFRAKDYALQRLVYK
jgi:hypothetical protein